MTNVLGNRGEALALAEATGRRGSDRNIPFQAGGQDSIFDLSTFENIPLEAPQNVLFARDVLTGKMKMADVPQRSQAPVSRLLTLSENLEKPSTASELNRLYDVGTGIADRTYPKGVDRWWDWGEKAKSMFNPEELKLRSHMAAFTSPGVAPAANMTYAMRNARQLDLGQNPTGGMFPSSTVPSIERYRRGEYYDPVNPIDSPMRRNPKTASMALALQDYRDVPVFDTERWGKFDPMLHEDLTIKGGKHAGKGAISRDETWLLRDRLMRHAEDQGLDLAEMSAKQWEGLSPNAPGGGKPWPAIFDGYLQGKVKMSKAEFRKRHGIEKPAGLTEEKVIQMIRSREIGDADPQLLAILGVMGVGAGGMLMGGGDETPEEIRARQIQDEERVRNRDRRTMDFVDQAQSGR